MFKIAHSLVTLALPALVVARWDASRYAWYSSDAGDDYAAALPIGNGRLGATVYGTADENLALNENSIWSGPWQDRANRQSAEALDSIRNQLVAGDITSAGQNVLNSMAGDPTSPREYNPLGYMTLSFGHEEMSDYFRYLDTYQGNAFVSYVYDGINYTYARPPPYEFYHDFD
jgi:hypothetical protein